jgi:hypothetical protein
MGYQTPALAYSDQVLGKAFLSQHRDNNDYFLGMVDRWRAIPEAVWWSWIAEEPSATIWDGWHLLTSDCKSLRYYFSVDNTGSTNSCRLYYDGVEVDGQTGSGTKDGTYSLAAKDAGFYQVQYRVSRTDVYDPGEFFCVMPWTTYTGSTSYTAGSVSDGSTIAATDFNKLRTNGLHFYANTPRNVPFIQRKLGFTGDSNTTNLWAGRIIHYGTKLYYGVELLKDGGSGGSYIQIFYNTYGGTPDVVVSDHGITEGSVTVSGSGSVNVHVVMKRSDTNGAYGRILYLYTVPASPLTWYPVPDYTVGQYVYGNTGGQTTAVNRLFQQQAQLASYLQRQDFATRIPAMSVLGKDWSYDYFFVRQHDLLYYKGTALRIVHNNGVTVGIPDAADRYAIFDLNSVSGLHLGNSYTLEGTIEYALEVPA